MKKGEFIQSDGGIYKLLLNETGNLEIWCTNQMVWSTYTYDKYIEFLYFGSDGIYLLGKDGSNRLNGTLDNLKQKANLLILQNDGNLVIFDKCGGIVQKYKPDTKCDKNPGILFFWCFEISLSLLTPLAKTLF